jgi:succinate-semialdehyde dehydrogenase / glutarate-semialdehyde dehydrogenase
VAEVSLGSREDANLALEAAKRAFPIWSEMSSQKRCEILHKASALVRERADHIARLLTLEQGKPLKNAKMEVMASAEVLDYYAEEGLRNFGQWITSGHSRSIVIKQPICMAALITPWNFPVDLLAWKVGLALAAGCTLVAKPPSLAPLAATEFIQAVNDSGLPPGAVNVVHGPGKEVGAELVENPISRKIAFTGETETGRWIMSHAAAHIKRISLELGGSIALHSLPRYGSGQSRGSLCAACFLQHGPDMHQHQSVIRCQRDQPNLKISISSHTSAGAFWHLTY